MSANDETKPAPRVNPLMAYLQGRGVQKPRAPRAVTPAHAPTPAVAGQRVRKAAAASGTPLAKRTPAPGSHEERDAERDAQRDAERDSARDAARDSERDEARDAERDEARDLARDLERDEARDLERDAKRDAIRDFERDTARDAGEPG